jgi:hypothetical protein
MEKWKTSKNTNAIFIMDIVFPYITINNMDLILVIGRWMMMILD